MLTNIGSFKCGLFFCRLINLALTAYKCFSKYFPQCHFCWLSCLLSTGMMSLNDVIIALLLIHQVSIFMFLSPFRCFLVLIAYVWEYRDVYAKFVLICSSCVFFVLVWLNWSSGECFCLTQWIPYIKPSLPAYKNLLVYNLVFTILLCKTRKNRQLMKQEYLLTWLFGQVSSHCHTTSYFKSCCLFSPIRLFFCLMRETMLRKTKTYVLSCLL